MSDHIAESKRIYAEHATAFRQTFGVQLRPFWDLITRFDIVRFDHEVIKPPAGRSTREVVAERHGAQAVKLIEALL